MFGKTNKSIAATTLAQMGVCERQVYFLANGAKKKGNKKGASKMAVAANRGNKEHERHLKQAIKHQSTKSPANTNKQDSRCFISSAIYGRYDYRTNVLRDFRDDVLLKTRAGEKIVDFYYKHSPSFVLLISKHKSLHMITKVIMYFIVLLVFSKGDK